MHTAPADTPAPQAPPHVIRILDRWDGHVLHEVEAPTLRAAVLHLVATAAAKGERADLSDADLRRADLSVANLSGANLSGADLSGANLSPIHSDVFAVLDAAPREVAALLAAVREGRVNGSAYEGACSCLVGTIATARGVSYREIHGLAPDADRLAERWFLMIAEGDTPATCAASALVERWILEYQAAHPVEGGAS